MSSRPHILVVGAGLIGLSTADSLLRGGARVTLLEAGDAVMGGASRANSGMLHPSQSCSWAGPANDPEVDAAVHDLALRSMALLRARMKEFGLTESLGRPSGCLQMFETEGDRDAAQARLAARGMQAKPLVIADSPFGKPSLLLPDDRSADAYAYGLALAESVRERGAVLQVGAPVAQVSSGDGKAIAVVGGERLEADGIVISGGTASLSLLKEIGSPVPIEPVRGWAADFGRPANTDIPDIPVMDALSRSALTPFEDRIRLSGTWGVSDVAPLLERWKVIAPDLMRALGDPLSVIGADRPVSALGRPFIGRTRLDSVWVNAGHGHMGWTLSAGSGALLSEFILGGSVDARFAVPSA